MMLLRYRKTASKKRRKRLSEAIINNYTTSMERMFITYLKSLISGPKRSSSSALPVRNRDAIMFFGFGKTANMIKIKANNTQSGVEYWEGKNSTGLSYIMDMISAEKEKGCRWHTRRGYITMDG